MTGNNSANRIMSKPETLRLRRLHRLRRGFALIATISVMVLLVMIALAMLSLSTIELRQSRQGKHQAKARANARMALMIAIGQVQQELGNDQVATMQATVLAAGPTGDGNIQAPDKTEPSNEYLKGLHSVRNPHWLGAHPTYDPETGDDRLFWIRRPNDEVYLYDSRYSHDDMSGKSDQFDRTQYVNWLVSNPSNSPLNPATLVPEPLQGTAEDFEYKISDGTFSGPLMYSSTHFGHFPTPLTNPNKAPALATIETRVPLVAVKDSQGQYSGGYAYIVSDDSLKYKISPHNAIAQNPENAPKKSDASSYSQLLVPQNVHLEKIRINGETDDKLSKLEQNNQTNASKTLTLASLPLQADDQDFAHQPAYKFNPFFQHSFTANGYGLLTDSVSGGLKRNLTAYLETPSNGTNQNQQITPITAKDELGSSSNGIIADSLSDTTPLLFSLREKDPQSHADGAGFMTDHSDPDKRLTWFAPVFGLLRDYVQLRNSTDSVTDLSLGTPVADPRAATQARGIFKNAWGSGLIGFNEGLLHSHAEPSAMTSWDADPSTGKFSADVYTPGSGNDKFSAPSMGLHPVLLKAAVYMYPCYDSTTEKIGNIWLPRVILYNPYNVKLAGKKYLVSIKRNSSRYGCKYTFNHRKRWPPQNRPKHHYFNVSNGTDTQGTLAGNSRDLVFTIDNTREGLMPGESLLFCADPSQGIETKAGGKYAKLFKAHEGYFDRMVLSSSVSPSQGTAFYSLSTTHPLWINGTNSESTIDMYSKSWINTTESKRMIKLFLPSTKANLSAPLDASSLKNYSLLQAIEASGRYEYRGFGCPKPATSRLYKDQVPNLSGEGGVTDPKQFDLRYLHHGWIGMRMIKDAEVPGESCPTRSNRYPVFQQHDIRAPYVGHTWSIAQNLTLPTRICQDGLVNYFGGESNLWVWGRDGTTSTVSDPLHVLSIDAPLHVSTRNGLNVMSAFTRTGTTRSDQASAPLFEVPRKDIPILSIAELRHARTNAFIGAPTYTLGESHGSRLSPRSGSAASWQQLLNSQKYTHWTAKQEKRTYFSWLNYCVPSESAPTWVHDIYKNFHYQIYDQSFEMNYALWDRFFLTGISNDTSSVDSSESPNPRMLKNPFLDSEPEDSDYTGYYKAGESFIIDGPFNVNSTNPLAWQALLSSFRKIDIPLAGSGHLDVGERSSFSRILTPLLDRNDEPTGLSGSGPVWQQTRTLTDEQIETLSLLIVEQVKRRAPFVSVSDFVNRRLVGGTTASDSFGPPTETELSKLGLKGPLQTAIDESGLNHYAPNDPNDYATPAAAGTENAYNPVTQKANTTSNKYANALGYLSQGDLLAKIGPLLTVRGDTFTIRAYGDSRDASGKVLASARCEAVIQRVTDYLDTAADPFPQARYSKLTSDVNRRFGRRFQVIAFRWLSSTE